MQHPRARFLAHLHFVSILTGPLGPVQHRSTPPRLVLEMVSILTGPLGPVQLATRSTPKYTSIRVSILTGPLGPVQRHARQGFQAVRVSILTGPLGPVQLAYFMTTGYQRSSFNPHRPFGAGATMPRG